MKDKKSVIIAVAVLVIIAAVGISVGVKNFKNMENPEAVQQVQNNDETGGTDNQANQQDSEKKDDNSQSEKTPNADNAQSSEAPAEKTPVFMYFVSEDDSNYNDALKVFEELKKDYEGKIEFDLKNVTKDPELLKNFSLVENNTPALIMDGKEGITGFQFKTTDKKTLEEEIQKALK